MWNWKIKRPRPPLYVADRGCRVRLRVWISKRREHSADARPSRKYLYGNLPAAWRQDLPLDLAAA